MRRDFRRRLLRAPSALSARTARRTVTALALAALLFVTQTNSLAEAAPPSNLLSTALPPSA